MEATFLESSSCTITDMCFIDPLNITLSLRICFLIRMFSQSLFSLCSFHERIDNALTMNDPFRALKIYWLKSQSYRCIECLATLSSLRRLHFDTIIVLKQVIKETHKSMFSAHALTLVKLSDLFYSLWFEDMVAWVWNTAALLLYCLIDISKLNKFLLNAY